MNQQQAVSTPLGVSVFGSCIMRVDPDLAALTFSVSRLAREPKEAFHDVRKATHAVRTYLAGAHVHDVGSSHVTLSQSMRYVNGEERFFGYVARVRFHVLLHDLDRIEVVLSGVIEAGADRIEEIDFQTSRLKEVRAETRRRAVAAAREKAQVYCEAAGGTLGAVLHIEDVHPDQLQGREGNVVRETLPDDQGGLQAFNPGSIVVGAAVTVVFQLRA